MYSSSNSSSSDEDVVFRRTKVYRPRVNHFNKWNESEFFNRFRLTKNTFQFLLQQIEQIIKLPTNKGGCISPQNQLLITLRFYATGCMLISADFANVSKASFYQISRFPKTVGTIDCTHIRIQSPGGNDAEIYRNRKLYFSVNVQTVSDSKLKIRNIVARWPGSVHDQTIFNGSQLKRDFEEGRFRDKLLLGDSGYALRPYLMTPLLHAHTEAEQLYNESHIRTRNTVERQYGVWKRRFSVLSLGMRLNIDTIQTVIVATAVIHNIAIDNNDPIFNDDKESASEDEDAEDVINPNIYHVIAAAGRQHLINNHFANL